MRELTVHIDGASKGNPGPAGVGIIISEHGQVLANISEFIGETTNNIAEYTALVYALQEALKLKAESLEINTDSQLLQRQISKVYKVKDPDIVLLYNQASRLLQSFPGYRINHIPREQNYGADKLATKAIKEKLRSK